MQWIDILSQLEEIWWVCELQGISCSGDNLQGIQVDIMTQLDLCMPISAYLLQRY